MNTSALRTSNKSRPLPSWLIFNVWAKMALLSASSGIAMPCAVYTVDKASWAAGGYAKRMFGCAFSCARDGILATCAHVANEPLPHEELVVQHPTEAVCHRAKILAKHSRYDIAFLKIDATSDLWPSPILEELLLRHPVFAPGLYDTTVSDGKIINIPQVFSGTITATPRLLDSMPTQAPFYQLSFPALPGFSGAPLYADLPGGFALCGMIFQNRTTHTILREVTEYKDEKLHFTEKISRGWDAGIAHTTMCIASAAKDLGVDIWK